MKTVQPAKLLVSKSPLAKMQVPGVGVTVGDGETVGDGVGVGVPVTALKPTSAKPV